MRRYRPPATAAVALADGFVIRGQPFGAEADGVIVIARAGSTDRGALRYAVEQLRAVKAPISGTVLNDLDYSGRGRYYGSGYGYGYYHRYYRQEQKAKT